ncbi:MAG: lysylphosphatidylglycerol synthase transmembrane domain-containing protein [Candidatus Aminicenantales bacterium]
MRKKRILSVAFSGGLSALLIGILISEVGGQDFVDTFAAIHIPSLLAFLGFSLAGATFRAIRYKWLLHPVRITWRDIFLVTFIRNLFVDLLPSRIGSLSYVYVLNRSLRYSFQAAASSFLMALVLDFLTLGPFLIMAILVVGLGKTEVSSMSLLVFSGVFSGGFLLLFWKLAPATDILARGYGALLRLFRLSEKNWALTSQKKVLLTQQEIRKIEKRKIGWPLFGLSLLVRLSKYLSLYFLLFALLRSHGFALADISFSKTILGITGAELTSALPIKGIGGFGTWESAWALTLMLLGFEARIAILSSGVHLVTNLFEYLLGISSILILALRSSKSLQRERAL